MSYLALYRAFRPKTFDQIVGQEHIVRTLVNQIKNDKVGHAYLFCGARGTGKTTAAKVFARAINCLSPVNGSPCGECEVCKKLDNPSNIDILEMDAASNNKVEHIRDIRDKIQYPPVAGKYKVYIIDEVHMLTTEAFNALLKTLEEPPAHAVFILATTESHKIPATILSRCLRFDFKLIPTPVIADTIANIYDKIGKEYTKEAVSLIAKAGEGSVRDALSVADLCVSVSEGRLEYDDVLEVLGASDRSKVNELIDGIIDGDTGKVLSVTDEIMKYGKNVGVLNRDVCSVLRDLLVIKTCPDASEILELPTDKLEELKRIADKADVHALLRYVEIFSAADADLKYSSHPKIIFETAAVKAGLPQADYNPDALIARVSKLEKKLSDISAGVSVADGLSAALNQKPFEKSGESADNGVIARRLHENTDNGDKQTAKDDDKTLPPEKSKPQPIAANREEKPTIIEAENFAFHEPSGSDNAIKSDESKKDSAVSDKRQAGEGAEKAWGSVLRKMRKDKEIMLWAACDDVSIAEDGKTFVICAPGENELIYLSKPESISVLKKYLSCEGYDDVKVVADKAEVAKAERADEQTERVKELFDGEKLVIKD